MSDTLTAEHLDRLAVELERLAALDRAAKSGPVILPTPALATAVDWLLPLAQALVAERQAYTAFCAAMDADEHDTVHRDDPYRLGKKAEDARLAAIAALIAAAEAVARD